MARAEGRLTCRASVQNMLLTSWDSPKVMAVLDIALIMRAKVITSYHWQRKYNSAGVTSGGVVTPL